MHYKLHNLLAPVVAIAVSMSLASSAAAQKDDALKDVKAKNITLTVPDNWKETETTSSMRAAQVEVPGEGDVEPAELVVFYFGGGATGGIKPNIDRWLGQFHEDGRSYELSKGKCRDGRFILLDIEGTYKKSIGPPAAGRTEDKPGSRVVNVILISENDDKEEFYFLKFAGDDELVKSNAKQLRASFGADVDSEKKIKLEEIDN